MSYGLFNWWWGEDTEESDWSWLIAHVNEIVEDVRPERKTQYLTLSMLHHTETREFNLGWLDFRFLSLSDHNSAINASLFDVDTVEGVANIANWMERNIRLPLDVDGNYDTIHPDTITAFIKMLKTHRPFYEENIKRGEPFVWIPEIPKEAEELWWREDVVADITDDFWRKIDSLFVDIGGGFICINPEANRVITHYLSDAYTGDFETVADTADWDYPQWYLDGSPP